MSNISFDIKRPLPLDRAPFEHLPKNIIVQIFLIFAKNHLVQEVASLRRTCKLFWNASNHPLIWETFCQNIPSLKEYFFCEKYYDIFKNYALSKKNIQEGKYYLFSEPGVWYRKYTENIIGIQIKNKTYISNMFQTKCYEIDDKIAKMNISYFGKFFISLLKKEGSVALQTLDLASHQRKEISLATELVKDEYTFKNTTIHISPLMCYGEKFLITLRWDDEAEAVDANVWDMETAQRKKTIKGIINNVSKHQNIHVFCKGVLCVKYDGEIGSRQHMVIYDVERGKRYEYYFNKDLFRDPILENFDPYSDSKYIAYYSSNDEVITFVHRDSGKKFFIDLGAKEENIKAIQKIKNTNAIWSFGDHGDNHACIFNTKEEVFLYSNFHEITVWDLRAGTCFKRSLKANVVQNISFLQVKDSIVDVVFTGGAKRNTIFDLKSLKILLEGRDCGMEEFPDMKGHVIFLSKAEDFENRDLPFPFKIYNTRSRQVVALQLDPVVRYGLSLHMGWENFLAIPSVHQEEGKELSKVSIFDIITGECISTVYVGDGKAEEIVCYPKDWLNGCLLLEPEEEDSGLKIVNFNPEHNFPKL